MSLVLELESPLELSAETELLSTCVHMVPSLKVGVHDGVLFFTEEEEHKSLSLFLNKKSRDALACLLRGYEVLKYSFEKATHSFLRDHFDGSPPISFKTLENAWTYKSNGILRFFFGRPCFKGDILRY